ncbi:hypothetical protein ISCGN_030262 [Ixodes scapularis]
MMPGYGGVFKFHGVDFLREASDKRLNDVRSAYLVNYAGSPLTIVAVEPDLLPTDGPIFLFPPDNEALKAAAECVPRILEELSRPEDLPTPSKISPRKVDFILPSSPHERYLALEEAFCKLEEETLNEIIAESSRPVIPCSARTFGESDLPRLLKKHVGRAQIEYLDELFTKDDKCLEDIQLLRDNTRFGQKIEGTDGGSPLHVLEDQLLASLPDEEICYFLELAILETQSLPRPPPQRPAEAPETFKAKQETYSCSGETQAEIEVSETEVKREPFMNLASAEAVAKVNSTAETLSFPSTPPVSPTTVPTTTQFGSQPGLSFASLEFEYSDSPPPSALDESRDPQQDSAPSEAVVKHELAELLHSQVECPFQTQQKSTNEDGASTDLPYMYQESEIPGDLADTENILTANQGVQQETVMTVPDERECCSSLQIEDESQLGSRRAQPSTSKDDSGACRVAIVAPQEVRKSEEELHLATPTDMTPANRALNFSDIFQDTCNNDLDYWSDTEIQIGEDVDCQAPTSSDEVPGERLNAAGSSSENGFFSVKPRCSWQTSAVALLPPKRPKLCDEEDSESAMEPITNEAFVQPPVSSFGKNAVNSHATASTARQKHRDVDKLQFLDFPADREDSQGHFSFGAFQFQQQQHQRNSYGMPVNSSSASDARRAQGEEELNVLAPRPRQQRSGERNDAVLRYPNLTGTDYSIYSDSEDDPDDTNYLEASDRPQLYRSFDAHYLDVAKQDNIDDSSLFDRRQRMEEGQRFKAYDPRNESTGNYVGTCSEFDSQGGSAGRDQMYHEDSSRMYAMGRRDPRDEASTLRPQVPDRMGESSYYDWNQTFPQDYEDGVGMSDESRDFDQHDQVIGRPHHIAGNIPSDDDTVDNIPVQDDSHPHPYRTIRKAVQASHASDAISYMNSGESITPRYMRQNVYGEPFQQNTARGFNPREGTPSIAPGYHQSTPKSRYENQSRNYEVPPESVSRDTLDELGDVDEFWNNDPRLAEECNRIAIQRGLVLSSPMATYAKTVWKKAPSAVLKPSEQKEPLPGGLYFQAIREESLDNSASS